MNFCFSSGRRAEAEASDRLVLVVDSSEASIEVDPTPLKRKQQNFQSVETLHRHLLTAFAYSALADAWTPGHIDANSESETTGVTSNLMPKPLIHGAR